MFDVFSTGQLEHVLVTYGYLAIFLVIELESTGVPLPGETMLILASVYAGTTHNLSAAMVIGAAALGAIAGDNMGFVIGRYGGYRLLRRYGRYAWLDERRLHTGERLFQRHGGKVVFLGRFVPVLRMWAAFLAGTHGMTWSRFLTFNAAGAVVWATTVGLAAYIFGNALLRSGGALSVASAAIALVTVGAVLLVMHRTRGRLGAHVAQLPEKEQVA